MRAHLFVLLTCLSVAAPAFAENETDYVVKSDRTIYDTLTGLIFDGYAWIQERVGTGLNDD